MVMIPVIIVVAKAIPRLAPQPSGQPTTLAPLGGSKPSVNIVVPDIIVPKVVMELHEGLVQESFLATPKARVEILIPDDEIDT